MGFKISFEMTGSEDVSVQSVRVQNFDISVSNSDRLLEKENAQLVCSNSALSNPMDILAPGQTVIIKQFRGSLKIPRLISGSSSDSQCRVTTFKNGLRFEKVKVIRAWCV